jgi:hypothetical protein
LPALLAIARCSSLLGIYCGSAATVIIDARMRHKFAALRTPPQKSVLMLF